MFYTNCVWYPIVSLYFVNVAPVMQKREYLVKYKGLAHVHNRWITEKQLLLEAPAALRRFKKKNKVYDYHYLSILAFFLQLVIFESSVMISPECKLENWMESSPSFTRQEVDSSYRSQQHSRAWDWWKWCRLPLWVACEMDRSGLQSCHMGSGECFISKVAWGGQTHD